MPTRTSTRRISRAAVSHRKPAKKAPSKNRRFPKADLEYFASRLRFLRNEAAEEIQSLSESMTPMTMTMDEQPGEVIDSEQTLLMIDRQRKLIGSLEAALQRLEEGSFGVCRNCGTMIDRGRLEAIPYTQLCLDCKSG